MIYTSALKIRMYSFKVVTAKYFRELTHNASKDISKDESPNADPQDDVNLDCDSICHLNKIFQDVIPVIQGEELKQCNECITESAVK